MNEISCTAHYRGLPLMAFDCITDFNSVTVSLNLAPITRRSL